ncbi:MAG: hypothetical protein KAR36_05330, partial [Candidatus Latescibacteria bacterium]|nr:hypothetical protein [Candidatus Latescibacterota bacterium]
TKKTNARQLLDLGGALRPLRLCGEMGSCFCPSTYFRFNPGGILAFAGGGPITNHQTISEVPIGLCVEHFLSS